MLKKIVFFVTSYIITFYCLNVSAQPPRLYHLYLQGLVNKIPTGQPNCQKIVESYFSIEEQLAFKAKYTGLESEILDNIKQSQDFYEKPKLSEQEIENFMKQTQAITMQMQTPNAPAVEGKINAGVRANPNSEEFFNTIIMKEAETHATTLKNISAELNKKTKKIQIKIDSLNMLAGNQFLAKEKEALDKITRAKNNDSTDLVKVMQQKYAYITDLYNKNITLEVVSFLEQNRKEIELELGQLERCLMQLQFGEALVLKPESMPIIYANQQEGANAVKFFLETSYSFLKQLATPVFKQKK